MNFLQPFMFWGALAIAIPIFIHFWHQKKGKELDWAAMQWLIDKSQQQSRGFRLDDLPMLVVRCLLILILTFLLSQPVIKWFKQIEHAERIHLVEPSANLVNNYRFEIETAIKNGDKVFWINPESEEIKDLSSISNQKNKGVLYLQEVINKVSKKGAKLDLYLVSDQKLLDLPKIYIPESYQLHLLTDSSQNYAHKYLELADGKKLFVNKGQLTVSSPGLSQDLPKLESTPVHSGKLNVLVEYKNKAEQQTVEAALGSLSIVYSLPMEIDNKNVSEKKYDLVLTDQKIAKINPEVLYVLSGKSDPGNQSVLSNVVQLQDSLRIQTSEMVNSGQLPEFIGDLLITHYKLDEPQKIVNQKQLNSLFVQTKPLEANMEGSLRPWLLIIFIALLILERWMALKKTIQKSYV
ncbi:BatA domain-containing protein [Dyadobacter subterraneus]|uniref:BatA domain-containing protein n=1 Tax=Dyadobacter subterraneus TaxID=2773304 RepID=A0ABR9WAH2_9BACT|nr:BatA domain-containing protein [Dyadobacter subterraneus]MBE9462445.1 BatA domain-containing protein [Dyadobacter subterraneus]